MHVLVYVCVCELEVCMGRFFRPGPGPNSFLFCRPSLLKKSPFICRPGLARSKNHLSFAGQTRPIGKAISHLPARGQGRVWASCHARVSADLLTYSQGRTQKIISGWGWGLQVKDLHKPEFSGPNPVRSEVRVKISVRVQPIPSWPERVVKILN